VDVADAMVDPTVELHRVELKNERTGRLEPRWLTKTSLDALPWDQHERIAKDEVVCPAGQLLVIDPMTAQEMGICRLMADDEASLLAGLAAEYSVGQITPLHEANPWWGSVVRFVTWWPVKVLLFVVGVVALVMAFAAPGHGPPEVVAALCLGAFFFGSYLVGLADHVELGLFVLGAVLLAWELVTPHFGVVGFSGLALMGASLLLSFQKFVLPHTPDEWAQFETNIGRSVLGVVGSLVALVVLARFAPSRFSPFRRLMLTEALPATVEPSAAQELAPVGTSAEAATVLRPVGKVRVGQDVFDAVCEEGFVPAGQAVVVIGHRVGQLVVAARPETMSVPPAAPERTA
jgi:membrane-bound serine protease (ClpP class)